MHFEQNFFGFITWPQGSGRKVELRAAPLARADEKRMFEFFDERIKKGAGFTTFIQEPNGPRVDVRFHRSGQTAAVLVLSDDARRVDHCFTALLTRLDPAEDRRAVEEIRNVPGGWRGVAAEKFDAMIAAKEPIAATYFTSAESAGIGALLTINRLAAAAFFSQFGIGGDYPLPAVPR
jgi:hypothetical protein